MSPALTPRHLRRIPKPGQKYPRSLGERFVHGKHELAEWLEVQGERVLRLEPEPKFFEKAPGEEYSTMREDWDPEKAHRHHMDRPWRGRVLDASVMFIRRLGGRDYGLRGWTRRQFYRVEQGQTERRLAQARVLRYSSSYRHRLNATEIDGYFDLGDEHYYGLSVYSWAYFREQAEFQWRRDRRGEPEQDFFEVGRWLDSGVVIPETTLTDGLIQEALRRWYKKRFRWQRGHWTWQEQAQPEIRVELDWTGDDAFPAALGVEQVKTDEESESGV